MELMSFVYGQSASGLIRAMPVMTILWLAYLGFSEFKGKHLQYSKFVNPHYPPKQTRTRTRPWTQLRLSSKIGMLLLYMPSALAGLASFFVFPSFQHDHGLGLFLLQSALTIHFLKRVLEVLFIHKYSGGMVLDSVIFISLSYFVSTTSMIYIQHLTLQDHQLKEPLIDLKYLGITLFLFGISGNFYHHCLLSKLRVKGEKGYKLPKGGLFNLVICPHYLFEIIGFVGIFFISQTMLSLSCASGIAFYLIARSCATKKWYISKFETNFPKEVKALIPYVL